MNYLANYTSLVNQYFVMRHGESKANHEDKIVSHEVNAKSSRYGLTALGGEQVQAAIEHSTLTDRAIIYASDYSRTRETADIVHNLLGALPPHFTPALRERYFGELEHASTDSYQAVWQSDAREESFGRVESPEDVATRATALVVELERKHSGENILLISHGDTLQILQCSFQGVSPYKHRDLKHLETAEIRQMALRPS